MTWPFEGDEVQTFQGLPWILKMTNSKGRPCDACGRLLKVYNRRLTSLIVAGMIRLFVLMERNPSTRYHHVRNLGVSGNGGEFAQARRWGFSEEAPKEKDKDTRTSGMWTLTSYGIDFLNLKVQAPLYAVMQWGSRHVGFSGEPIDARKAVEHRNKFSYSELMGGIPPVDF